MRPRLLALPLFALAAGLCPADDPSPPGPTAVDALLKDLADEDAAKRDSAESALAALGPAVRPRLEAELARQDLEDAETRARIESCLGRIALAERWAKAWKEDAGALAEEMVAHERCAGCGTEESPWIALEIPGAASGERFRDLKFYALRWNCCRASARPDRVVAVGREPGRRAECDATKAGIAAMAAVLPPAKTEDEAAESAELALRLVVSRRPVRPVDVTILETKCRAREDGGFEVRMSTPRGRIRDPIWWKVEFDGEGRIRTLGLAEVTGGE
jgi:hypothetical protein